MIKVVYDSVLAQILFTEKCCFERHRCACKSIPLRCQNSSTPSPFPDSLSALAVAASRFVSSCLNSSESTQAVNVQSRSACSSCCPCRLAYSSAVRLSVSAPQFHCPRVAIASHLVVDMAGCPSHWVVAVAAGHCLGCWERPGGLERRQSGFVESHPLQS